MDGVTRDVLLAWRWASPALRAMVAERARAGRGTRVLTLGALADLLTVRDGRIAELPRLQIVSPANQTTVTADAVATPPAPAPSPVRRSAALDGLREITRWNEITLFEVDENDLIGVTFDQRLRRLSCVNFGLATVNGRRPLDVFVLLKTICQGNGNFSTRAFGSKENGKRLVSQLRTAMRKTFGLRAIRSSAIRSAIAAGRRSSARSRRRRRWWRRRCGRPCGSGEPPGAPAGSPLAPPPTLAIART